MAGGRVDASGPWAAERDEIAKIDFLLDNLARAVERGEVHRASYDLMAPRFLQRRAELVAIVTGRRPAATAIGGAVPTAGPAPAAPGTASAATTAGPRPLEDSRGAPATRTTTAREPKPVRWTTVLTFLGAFLVVVAAAIFAIGLWDVIGTSGKLIFMGVLTLGFYGAGWYAHGLGLRAGGIALTAVASAMLLFEGWIAIDGYDLTGPVPWAIVLLVCSAAYWATEVWLAERFFGVVGAAAQVGWWWLLGEGLGLSAPVRFAGLAVVALAWQIAAERGRDNETVGSLASVLEWAAPVTGAIVLVGLVRDLQTIPSVGMSDVIAAGVACAAVGVLASRTRLAPRTSAQVMAAVAQLPLFAYFVAAWGTGGATWGLVTVAVAMALSYDTFALVRGGIAFAVAGLAAELTLVLAVCDVLDATESVTVVAVAALAVMWAIGARIAESSVAQGGFAHVREVGAAARVGALVLLGVSSIASVAVGEGLALAGVSLPISDVVVALSVLAAWYASGVVLGDGWVLLAGTVWSFYTLAAVMSWAIPDQRPEVYALALVGLGAVWLASTARLSGSYGDLWQEVSRWSARGAVLLCVVGGLVVGAIDGWDVSWWPSILVFAAAVVYLGDAVLTRCATSAAAAGALGVWGAALAGAAIANQVGRPGEYAMWAVAGTAAGVAICGAMAAIGRRTRRLAVPATVAAAATASLCAVAGIGEHGPAGLSFALLALAWTSAAVLVSQWLMLPAGLAVLGSALSVLAWNDGPASLTVIVLSLVGLGMGLFAFTRPGGPKGRLAQAGLSLVAAAMAAHLSVIVIGVVAQELPTSGWTEIGLGGIAVGFAVLGAHAIVQGARWEFEPAYYAGGLAWVFGVWSALGWAEVVTPELFSTALALYLVACGYVSSRSSPSRRHRSVLDGAAVVVGLGYPLVLALRATTSDAGSHALWVLGLSVLAIAGGVAAKSRWYFFGGTAALVVIAAYRSFVVLAEFWWVLLGLLGVAMLIVALTWERQRILVADTRSWLRRSFEGWR